MIDGYEVGGILEVRIEMSAFVRALKAPNPKIQVELFDSA